ncbi:helix-turn-helix domain-containing protein [Zunongwangia pacifica]|uniref:ATP-binding protein n=1 Tax=Zunongwangia pacifica TaxID=2911062 RepID=A0A9X2CPX2_9FLAO|nr:ATP-binding protein [Zunongwangia pacifica]MCL6220694.1 ATP-binding protein [Zunongwangia pacifica]
MDITKQELCYIYVGNKHKQNSMYLFGTKVDRLEKKDIIRLIENQIQESKTLDYKKELNLQKDNDKKEFLYDVSAMYNTDGGCIIFGIEEEKDENDQNTGKPLQIVNLEVENFDKLSQQIEDILKNSTDPSITHIALKEIQFENGKILILGIPKGLGLPSMVTYKSSNKFYKRRNSGKFLVDTFELNQMFLQNQAIVEKIKNFRRERIEEVISLDTLPNLDTETSFFIHIIPNNFQEQVITDFTLYENDLKREMKPFSYSYNSGWNYMYNIDGYMTYSSSDNIRVISKYNQLFRNGTYEIYSSKIFAKGFHEQMGFDGPLLMDNTIFYIEEALKVLNKVDIDPPFYISFSFRNVKGKVMNRNSAYITPEFTKDNIDFPLINVSSYDANIKELLKPNFDILWQIFGYAKSPIL